jgi:hypothetical protein
MIKIATSITGFGVVFLLTAYGSEPASRTAALGGRAMKNSPFRISRFLDSRDLRFDQLQCPTLLLALCLFY